MAATHSLFQKLPHEVTQRSSHLIGIVKSSDDKNPEERVKDLLQTTLPRNKEQEIDDKVNKNFSTVKTKKGVNSSLQNDADQSSSLIPNRKRLTSRKRKELGLHKFRRDDKTFEMFLPINELWKSYARNLLGIRHFEKLGWRGDYCDSRTESIQNRLKKVEYFGCLIRVGRSRCSELVGIVGIVIQETRNTFVVISPDDKVRTIPKLHSEFCFVVENVGFSVLGNYLHQRPVDRAKHSFKKHCLWL